MRKDSRPNGSRHSLNLMCPSLPHACNSDVIVVPTYFNAATFAKNLLNNFHVATSC
jgi:hypothetical protein